MEDEVAEERGRALERAREQSTVYLKDGQTVLAFSEYQTEVRRTIFGMPEHMRPPCYALGIAGEAGEVADLLKKHLFHGHELDRAKLTKELGDVLWYVAALSDVFGLRLSDVATVNVDKLRKRFPTGFSSTDSIKRADVENT